MHQRTAVGWGLLPTHGDHGVLVVAGGQDVNPCEVGSLMARLGVAEAVATDPSGCAMFSCGGRHVLEPPRHHRRAIQRFGLCCGAIS
jgi:hypothetical protein